MPHPVFPWLSFRHLWSDWFSHWLLVQHQLLMGETKVSEIMTKWVLFIWSLRCAKDTSTRALNGQVHLTQKDPRLDKAPSICQDAERSLSLFRGRLRGNFTSSCHYLPLTHFKKIPKESARPVQSSGSYLKSNYLWEAACEGNPRGKLGSTALTGHDKSPWSSMPDHHFLQLFAQKIIFTCSSASEGTF